jgi:uncharacterized Zn finger protein (UPF0148 family)
MPYCSNCGTSINNNIKFCPNCGTKMENISQKTEQSSKNKMEKGVVKSLKKEVTDTVTSRLKSTISKNPLNESIFNDSSSEIKDNNPTSGIKKSFKKLIIIYLLISIFLLILGQKSDEIIGVQYFSIFILVAYGIRHKKEKPFNWFLKIILILQLILIFSVFMTSYKYFFSSFFSLLAGLSILGLFIVNILLLFKGNKI